MSKFFLMIRLEADVTGKSNVQREQSVKINEKKCRQTKCTVGYEPAFDSVNKYNGLIQK
jgi:hypothetical protein